MSVVKLPSRGRVPLPTDPKVDILNPRQLLALGMRPAILRMVADGMSVPEITKAIRNEYGYRTQSNHVSEIVRRMGPIQELTRIAMLKDQAEMHMEAIAAYNNFKDEYYKAKVDGDVEKEKLAAGEWRAWWDRRGKFSLPKDQDPALTLIQAQTVNQISNPVQIVIEELSDNPEAVEKLLKRMREGRE